MDRISQQPNNQAVQKMDDFQRQVQELLEKAMQQPGVAEVVKLYEAQRSSTEAFTKAQHAVSNRWIVSSSTSSTPL